MGMSDSSRFPLPRFDLPLADTGETSMRGQVQQPECPHHHLTWSPNTQAASAPGTSEGCIQIRELRVHLQENPIIFIVQQRRFSAWGFLLCMFPREDTCSCSYHKPDDRNIYSSCEQFASTQRKQIVFLCSALQLKLIKQEPCLNHPKVMAHKPTSSCSISSFWKR